MFIDFEDPQSPTSYSADVVVAGSGPGGVSLSLDLEKRGISVLLLEAGGVEYEDRSQQLYAGENLESEYPIESSRLRQFGGSSGHWSGQCGRLRRFDVNPDRLSKVTRWPIDYSEIENFYEHASEFLEIGPIVRPDRVYSVNDVAYEEYEPGSFCYNYHWRFRAVDNRPTPLAIAERDSPKIRDSQTITCVLHANVVDADRSDDGRDLRAFRIRTLGGRAGRVAGRIFVLACGGLENPRLLLNMIDGGALGSMDAARHVGAYFQDHPNVSIGQVATTLSGSNYVAASNRWRRHGSDDVDAFWKSVITLPKDAQLRGGVGGASFEFYPTLGWKRYMPKAHMPDGAVEKIWYLVRNFDEIAENVIMGRLFSSRRKFSTRFAVSIELEQHGHSANRVSLAKERDPLGLRKMQLSWRIRETEIETVRFAARELAAFLTRAGLGRMQMAPALVDETGAEDADWGVANHHIGTTRMAKSESAGVVDANLRYFGTTNLYVAGSSVFPTGGFANPTLTIVALSHRLAAHLSERLRA